MLTRRALSIVALAVTVTCVTLTGCPRQTGSTPAPVGTQPQPELQASRISLKMAVQDKTCYLPVVVALDQGFYADEGLDV